MNNETARKMRNFKKKKHLKLLSFFKRIATKTTEKINRANRSRYGNSTKIMRIGIIDAIREQLEYNKRQRAEGYSVSVSENTITNKNLRRAMGNSAGTNQRKRRKRIASNPSLLRGKYSKHRI